MRFSRKRTPSMGSGPNSAPDSVAAPGLLGSRDKTAAPFDESAAPLGDGRGEYCSRAEADGNEGNDGSPQRPLGELLVVAVSK